MKFLLTTSFCLLLFIAANAQSTINNEQIILHRLTYLSGLKKDIDAKTWSGINNKSYDVPLIYYTNTTTYIVNPTPKFLSLFSSKLLFQNPELKIYKTDHIVDSSLFHFATHVTNDNPEDYSYNMPFMECSSFEITKNVIQDVNAVEQWATMVLHEYFHGFQFMHKGFLNYFMKRIDIRQDSLLSIYKNNRWFANTVNQENDLLLKALTANNKTEIKLLLLKFFYIRNQRRSECLKKLNFSIQKIESAYETVEGTARYVEYHLYKILSVKSPDKDLALSDSSYKSNNYYKDYTISKDKWLYLTEKTAYYYATGFNMARLLDKLEVNYKNTLFTNPTSTLEIILQHYINEL